MPWVSAFISSQIKQFQKTKQVQAPRNMYGVYRIATGRLLGVIWRKSNMASRANQYFEYSAARAVSGAQHEAE